SDRGANRVAGDDGPTGECRLCQWSGTNGAREGMQLPAPEEGYCATGQGGLTRSQDGGLKGREGGTQGRERDSHVRRSRRLFCNLMGKAAPSLLEITKR
ncbi:hypothetical protein JOQ06_013397, partial [Pogonophryne albipinna]